MDLLPVVSHCLDLHTGEFLPVVRVLAWPIHIGQTDDTPDEFNLRTGGPAGVVTHAFTVRHGTLSTTESYCCLAIRPKYARLPSGVLTWQAFEIIGAANDDVRPGSFTPILQSSSSLNS